MFDVRGSIPFVRYSKTARFSTAVRYSSIARFSAGFIRSGLFFGLACFVLFSQPGCSSAKKKGGGSPVTIGKDEQRPDKLVKQIRDKYRRKFRLAILDFTDEGGKRTAFGSFVADQAVILLGSHPDIRLMERSRLKILLKEQALNQSGIMEGRDVKALGSILPVDAILVGSYVRRDREGFNVHCRFIDVVTGEIPGTFTFFLRHLQPETKGSSKKSPEEITARCRRVQEPVLESLKDLRSGERVEALVEKAVMIPFDLDCGRVHFRIIAGLEAAGLYPRRYRKFLGAALAGIADPGGDKRTRPILEYFGYDRKVDDEEWKAALEGLKNSGSPYSLSAMLGYLFRHSGRDIEPARQDLLMRLARQREIGKPRLLEDGQVSLALLTFFRRNVYGTPENFVHYYEHYGDLLPRDSRTQKRLLGYLHGRYKHAVEDQKQAGKYRGFLIQYYRRREKTAHRVDLFWDLLRSLQSMGEREQKEGERTRADDTRKELGLLIAELNDWACAGIQPGQSEEREQLLRKQGAVCKNMATIADLIKAVRSRDPDKKLRAAKNLVDLGEKARPAEETARRYLTIEGSSYNRKFLRQYCARILGNIKTADPRSIKLLIKAMIDYEGAGKDAMDALEKIGRPAVGPLADALRSSREHGIRYRAVIVLGRIGRQARSALPALRRVAEKDSSSELRRRARAAVYSIENDR